VVFCGLLLPGDSAGPSAKAQANQSVQAEDPHKDSRVLVEAFVVEVKLSALYDLGVSPIGQKPNSVSVENILKCLLNDDWARVTAGTKLALSQQQRGSTEATETIYVPRQAPVPPGRGRPGTVSRSFESYSTEKTFDGQVSVRADGRIFVGFTFSQHTVDRAGLESDAPPARIERDWSGSVCLEAGKPSIVGAMQDEQMAAFLIISADIRCK
jgi:hypothetical protein